MSHIHTHETIAATYWRNGKYDKGAFRELNYFLRDWRTDDIMPIDPQALDFVHGICDRLGVERKVQILCGYRSPKTNAMLRQNSSGVAKKSLHLQGRAIDFRVPGQNLHKVHRAALAMQAGGVGLYTRSDFIHVDTGAVRNWGR